LKRTRSRDSSSIFFISKWIIIAAIVIVSSLSFTLGYYVGKRDHSSDNNQLSTLSTDNNMAQNDAEPAVEEGPPPDWEQKQDVRSSEAMQPIHEQMNTHQTKHLAGAKHNEATLERQKSQPPRNETKNITYSVQAGAFKSAHEASTLKENLDKKGYTAYVIQSETKNHEKLYKVLIGKFSTRKAAEVLSLKIKKAEGLQTFVTFRTQEDILR
jgi:cell division septation protein DedD